MQAGDGLILVTATLVISGLASLVLLVLLSVRSTPLAIPLTCAVCFAFAISSLLLLPVDAAGGIFLPAGTNSTVESAQPWPALVAFWRSLYWVTLILGWLAAETLCELVVAGDFSRASRVRSAIRASARLYLAVLGFSLAGALYLLIWLHVPFGELQSVAALLINGHGVLFLALLQGQGVV